MNDDLTRLAATTNYRRALEHHQANDELIAQRDPRAEAPNQVWMLGLQPSATLARALRAELYDPTPHNDSPYVRCLCPRCVPPKT